MINRGIKYEDIYHYLNTDSDYDILSPLLIARIEEAAKLLIKHISLGSKIFIQVDADCDGYTSAALLINYLNKIFPSFTQSNISYRLHEGKQHGIILDTIPAGTKLVICPDSSSNDYEEHKALQEKGIDVLVIDHHEAEKVSEYACVLNNQLCDYPTKSLSGVGMVYKFCSYLDILLNKNEATSLLDLVAVGMVADMMDLRDFETKHLIQLGLKNIQNPFLKAMIAKQEYSLGSTITPIGIAFYIAPYINAITRSGTLDEKLVVFESMLEFRAYELIPSTKRGCKGDTEVKVEQACRNCVNVKNRQAKACDANLVIIQDLIEKDKLLDNKVLAIVLPSNVEVNKNLNGLIANQLMSEYQRPVFVLTQTDHEGTPWVEGSARNFDKAGIKNLRSMLEMCPYVEYAEGHESAFGIGLYASDFNHFIYWCNEVFKNKDFTPKYDVDFIYQAQTIKDIDIMNIAMYKELWGQGINEPLVVIENVNISKDQITLMKRNTLKITLPNSKLSFIKFGSSEEEFNELYSSTGYINVNILGRCDINSWNDSPQIRIVDYEIVKKSQYYF